MMQKVMRIDVIHAMKMKRIYRQAQSENRSMRIRLAILSLAAMLTQTKTTVRPAAVQMQTVTVSRTANEIMIPMEIYLSIRAHFGINSMSTNYHRM